MTVVRRALGVLSIGPAGVAAIVALPLVAAAVFYVWAEITTVRLGYLLSQAGDAHRVLLEENRGLRIEAAALKAPERLKRLAEEYKLESPRFEQIVRLGESAALAHKTRDGRER
jgi:hypothetical protein